MHGAGNVTKLLCEIDPGAQNVLEARFPGIPLVHDIREIDRLPDVDLVSAGFPCQDLSQAGRTAGIGGRNSGLIEEVFRLVSDDACAARWLLLENVPFMLQLARGRAMTFITDSLAALGFMWAYRVIDTRSFGLPQRRRRVVLLASRTEDPRPALFAEDRGEPDPPSECEIEDLAYGFYWTEGVRGLGWAVDAIPTLKGGSTIGIASPPAIWFSGDDHVGLPDIRDAERLQGFPADWTEPAISTPGVRPGHRWKLIGNAVSVPLAGWVGERLCAGGVYDDSRDAPVAEGSPWPKAAWGREGAVHRVEASPWPVHTATPHLPEFLRYPTKALSVRATVGFLRRTDSSSLRFPEGFLDGVRRHLERMEGATLFAVPR